MPSLRLCIEARQLSAQNRALPFAKAIIRAIDVMAIEPFARHTATVMDAASLFLKRVVVGDDHAAFTRSHELARLKTERSRYAVRAYAFASPLGGVGVGAVFDQCNSLLLREIAKRIQIRWMAAHVHGNDCFCPRGDGRFGEFWINAITSPGRRPR